MKIIKNSTELAALLTPDKDLIVDEDVRIEYQVAIGELRDVKCGDLFLMNDNQKFDFNGGDFNGGDFNGDNISYWAFFNCTGKIRYKTASSKRDIHAPLVSLINDIQVITDTIPLN